MARTSRSLKYALGAVALLALAFLIWAIVVTVENNSSSSLPQVDCDVLIVGYGPGGGTMAYRLAPIYGNRLCIVDERDYVGGKIFSYQSTLWTPEQPIYSPTCSEQLRDGDVILRCMQQELVSPTVKRGPTGNYAEAWARGRNNTGYTCYGSTPPPPGESATCAWGLTYEGSAPNGFVDQATYINIVNNCGNQSWADCSYEDQLFAIIFDPVNVATITPTESYGDYVQRVVGQEGRNYMRDIYSLVFQYDTNYDARYMIDYFNYDFAYNYGLLTVPHGGPQQSIWLKTRNAINANGAHTYLNEKALSVSHLTGSATGDGYAYGVGTTRHNFRAKRLVLAIPAPAVANLTGDVGLTLGQNDYVQYAKMTAAGTWNGFFPYMWWRPRTSEVCLDSYCAFNLNFTLSALEKNYTQWSFWDNSPGGFTFIRFNPTPERQAGNLLRVYWEDQAIQEYNDVLETGGQAAVTALVMSRLRAKFGLSDGPIPDPVDSFFKSEKNGYTYLQVGVPFTATQQTVWAAEPLAGEKLCLVGESFDTLNAGWMEGAANTAHNCMRGPVFSDVVSASTVNSWESCINPTTEVVLDYASSSDECLLLENEYVTRDLAGLDYCGGPSVYPFPNSSYFNTEYGVSSAIRSTSSGSEIRPRAIQSKSIHKKTSHRNRKHGRYMIE